MLGDVDGGLQLAAPGVAHVHRVGAVRDLVVVVDVVVVVVVVVVIVVVVDVGDDVGDRCGGHHHEGEEAGDREDTLLLLDTHRGGGHN